MRKQRRSLWFFLTVFLIAIPILYYFDNRQISEDELYSIHGLRLSRNPSYIGGKSHRVNIYVLGTERVIAVNYEELECAGKDKVLSELRMGDTITIKIPKSDTVNFYGVGYLLNKYQKIYGLYKNGKEYIGTECRNLVSENKNRGAIFASVSSAILSLILLFFVFTNKPHQKRNIFLKVDPGILVCGFWLLLAILFRIICA